jgi:hypothetical protein
MNETIQAYINYFKSKKTDNCQYTNNFIQNYQQEISKNGYGYINLADYINYQGKTHTKLNKNSRDYYEFLINSKDISNLEELIGMPREDILNVSIDAKNGKPNQKWHLLVSYLGMAWFQDKKVRIGSVICPELWLWMFESSGIFTKDELKYVYNKAIEYKTKKIACSDWKKHVTHFRKKLDNAVRHNKAAISRE